MSETDWKTLAEVLAAHQTEQLWKAGGWAGDTACSCGWRMAMWTKKDFPEVHRAHVAAAVTAHLAAILADPETVEAVAQALTPGGYDSPRDFHRLDARIAIAVIAARIGVAS